MKTILSSLTLLCAMSLIFISCRKDETEYETFFYTDKGDPGELTLFLNGESKGILPLLHVTMRVNNDTLIQNAIHIKLKSGKHKIAAKNQKGEVKSETTLKFNSHSVKSSGNMGGSASSSSKDTLILRLFY